MPGALSARHVYAVIFWVWQENNAQYICSTYFCCVRNPPDASLTELLRQLPPGESMQHTEPGLCQVKSSQVLISASRPSRCDGRSSQRKYSASLSLCLSVSLCHAASNGFKTALGNRMLIHDLPPLECPYLHNPTHRCTQI